MLYLNYRIHTENLDEELHKSSMLFAKASTTVTNTGDPIVYPDPIGEEWINYEVELGVIIDERGKDLSEAETYDRVTKYTVITQN